MKNIFIILLVLLLFYVFIERNFLPETDDKMRKEAYEYGITTGKEMPPKEFYFDGCSLFPESFFRDSFRDACLRHDIAYWYGGTQEERKNADLIFKKEISESGVTGKILNFPMYIAVRLVGDSFVAKFFGAEWGFGHSK